MLYQYHLNHTIRHYVNRKSDTSFAEWRYDRHFRNKPSRDEAVLAAILRRLTGPTARIPLRCDHVDISGPEISGTIYKL